MAADTKPPAAADVERRKKVRLRIRRDLSIAPQKYEGRTYYVVKDPVSLRYYRFKEQEHFLINLMDGTHTLDDAQKAFEKRFRPDRLTLEDLEQFGQQLLTAGLAQNESPQAGKQLFDRRKKRRRSEIMQAITNILYIKIPVFDPDKILTRILNQGLFPSFLRLPIQILFVAWSILCVATTVLGPILLALAQFGLLGVNATQLSDVIKLDNLFHQWLIWLCLYAVYRVSRDLKFVFTAGFLWLSVAVMSAAILLVATHFETFYARLPDYHAFFSFKAVFYLWFALGAVKIIHEFGHGLSCKAFGGEVHEMGALFLVFSPCLYCNVSDAWTLPDKWKRIIISSAGIYVELIIAAIATFVWWNTPSHPFVNNLSLSLMIVCSVSTVVFNANPLMRYDGYYVLADWIEIPNLRERCNRYMQRIVMEHCLGMEVQPEPYMALWRRILFLIYAVVSYIYRWVVTFSILWFMSKFLEPYKLGVVSFMLAVAAAASMVGWPLFRLGKNLHKRGRLPDMKALRVTVSVAALVAVLIAACTVPLPVSRVRQTALVQVKPEAFEKVYVVIPGTLEALYVKDGQPVEKGDLIAEFRSLELEAQLEEARAKYDIANEEYKAMARLAGELGLDRSEQTKLGARLAQAAGDRETYGQMIREYERNLEALKLVAPRAGIVMSPPRVDQIGKYFDKDQQQAPFCSIGDPKELRALVPLAPDNFRLLRDDREAALKRGDDLDVTIRVQGRDQATWKGKIAFLPESEAKDVPIQLTNKGGGPLAIKQSSKQDVLVPQSQQYLVVVDFLDPDDAICPGTLAQVKVHCQWRTAAWWAWRAFSTAFDLGMEPKDLLPPFLRPAS
jgi:putative peptide zinc metalloprotease protein